MDFICYCRRRGEGGGGGGRGRMGRFALLLDGGSYDLMSEIGLQGFFSHSNSKKSPI